MEQTRKAMRQQQTPQQDELMLTWWTTPKAGFALRP
jgi:hypothetical protein